MSIVEFPGLWGLKFTINNVAFTVFGIPIYWYGIIIASGFLLAVLLGMRDSRKFGLEPDNVIDLVLYAAPVAIVTSRLYYVIFNWSIFKDDLLQIFNTRRGGLAIYGAVIGALAVGYIFAKTKRLSILGLFDFGSPYIILAQGIGRWGNFINQEAYGINTTLPWGMTSDTIKKELLENMDRLQGMGINIDPNMPVHPTFLYESLWDIAVFFFLIWYRKRKKMEGEVFFLYMILYGVGRFWIESLRTDSLMVGNLRVSQFLAAVFAIVFTAAFIARRKIKKEQDEEIAIGTSKYGEILRQLKEQENVNKEDSIHIEESVYIEEEEIENKEQEDFKEAEIEKTEVVQTEAGQTEAGQTEVVQGEEVGQGEAGQEEMSMEE